MGHTHSSAVAKCRKHCPHPKLAVSVRDPYAWWRSTYTYGWYCRHAAHCSSGSFDNWVRSAGKGLGYQSDLIPRGFTFDYILRTESLQADFEATLQAEGLPIYELLTENPTGGHNDPGRLLYIDPGPDAEPVVGGRAPRRGLNSKKRKSSKKSKTRSRKRSGGQGPPPPTVFTAELLKIINQHESRMFDEFGYTRRVKPFELK
jgi:hypothetical protein